MDLRLALVEFFRDEAEVMIATEAAAEGVNLQFCALVINYDLPWNLQRIEQRIGRCHRYGQKHDVVVINFLNADNVADQRIYELLREKFKLFDGVFGASDEILGRIESGIDFERRILTIFETCRRPEEIDAAFATLQAELDQPIQERIAEAHQMLLEHFDEEVVGRLKLRLESTRQRLDAATRNFWLLTRYIYRDQYYFNDDTLIFGSDPDFIARGERPRDGERVPIYHYLDLNPVEPADPRQRPPRRRGPPQVPVTGYPYRMSDLMGEAVLRQGRELAPPPATLTFHRDGHPHRLALLDPYRERSGWLWLDRLTIRTFEENDTLLFIAFDDAGTLLAPEFGEKLFLLPATVTEDCPPCPHTDAAMRAREVRVAGLLDESERNNHRCFNEELDKLDRWADDLKASLELDIKQLDREIKEIDRAAKQRVSLQEKLAFQKQKAALEKRRSQKRHDLFTAQDAIDRRREELIAQLERQLETGAHAVTPLFHIAWRIV